MTKFLFEILTEEIPSYMQIKAQDDIVFLFRKELQTREITFSNITSYSTPRRITIVIDDLPKQIETKIEQKRGPRVDASKTIINSFLEKNNLALSNCKEVTTNKGSFLFYEKTVLGGDVKDIIIDVIFNVLKNIKFKKSMKWNNSGVVWARPIRGLLALLDNEFLKFSFAGVQSSNKTQGHRFLSKGEIVIESIEHYFSSMKKNYVVLDFNIRKEIIKNKIDEITNMYEINYDNNDNLLNEICYLVEYPEILIGEIPPQYIFLPKELLKEIIEKNQKYICFSDIENNLYNKYMIVSNISTPDNGKTIVDGNSKVLKARLDDGLFFYKNDLKSTLQEKSNKLKNIIFIEGFGTLYEKTLRVNELFQQIFQERQNQLCEIYKGDLCSEVVLEIPELQGVMGYYYAKAEGVKLETALAIRDQYKPQGHNDSLPETLLGAKLSLLDKLDSLISFFEIGKKPTSSKDPFALRRAALGIIRIIEKYELDIDLFHILSEELRFFFQERLNVYLSNIYNKTAVNSVINSLNTSDNFNMLYIIRNVKTINSVLLSDVGEQVVSLYKRIFNILLSEKQEIILDIKEKLFQTEIEELLFGEITQINKDIIDTDISKSLSYLSKLIEPAGLFLDNHQIYTNQEDIKNNRIALLKSILNLYNKVLHWDGINI